MNKTVVIWMALAALLAFKSFRRPSYAVGLYMLTFFAAPKFWWWGDLIEGYRWNFYAGVILLVTVLFTAHRNSDGERPVTTGAVPFVLLMAANAIFVHFAFAANADASLGWLILRLKFILLFFLLQYSIKDEKDYRITALAIALGIGYIGYEVTFNERGSFSGGRLEGVGAAGVQSSNQLASLLITAIPIAVSAVFTSMKRWIKALVLVSAGLAFNVVLLCNSRGAFLGVLLGGVVFLLLAGGSARKRSLKLAAVALVGAFILNGDPRILERFMTTFTSEGQRDSSAQSRIVFWSAASRMLAEYPLGSGGNSFSEGRGARYLNANEMEGSTRAIHNGFLTELVDWGVQGFGFTLLFFGAVWFTIWKGRRLALNRGDPAAVLAFATLGAAFASWLMSSLFGDYLDEEWGYWTAALVYAFLRVRLLAAETVVDTPAAVVGAPQMATAMPRGTMR